MNSVINQQSVSYINYYVVFREIKTLINSDPEVEALERQPSRSSHWLSDVAAGVRGGSVQVPPKVMNVFAHPIFTVQ